MSEHEVGAVPPRVIPCPPPGVYPGVPMGEYLAWDACSCSRLSDLEVSPARCLWVMEHGGEEEDTDATILGSATHTTVLEPARFDATYYKLSGNDRRLKAIKEEIEVAEGFGRIPLRQKDYDMCAEVRAAVWGNRTAGKFLTAAAGVEVSCVAELRTASGAPVRFKIRPDIVAPAFRAIVDLKSAIRGDLESFARVMRDRAYHRSGAMYLAALGSLGAAGLLGPIAGEYEHAVLLTAEKDREVEVDVYQIAARALQAGLASGMELLGIWAQCRESGVWPKRADTLKEIDLPAWHYTRAQREEFDTDGGGDM